MPSVEQNINSLKTSICCIKKQLLNGDIIIENSNNDFPLVGEVNKLYIATDTGVQYYWDGVSYLPIVAAINIVFAANYSALPSPATVSGEFYWVEAAQGTRWLPGSLGGTYYPLGIYYSNGTTWTHIETPYQATQVEVDVGVNNDKFVTALTLANSTQWDTKLNVVDLPSNLVLYPTTATSDIATYYKLVTDIHDVDFNTTAADINTGVVTTTSQLISSLVTTTGLITGNPGVFNITVVGNIRKISGSGNADFYFEVYKRSSVGTETLIGTSNSTLVVSSATYEQFSATALWDDGIFVSTDRIVLKFYANRISGGSNPEYQFQFGGITPVRTLVPVPLSTIGYTKTEVDSLLLENLYTWDYFATNWSVEPTLNTTITGGEVYNYILNGTTRYRFVPTTYNPTQDAFYANFDGVNLTNLIITRG